MVYVYHIDENINVIVNWSVSDGMMMISTATTKDLEDEKSC